MTLLKNFEKGKNQNTLTEKILIRLSQLMKSVKMWINLLMWQHLMKLKKNDYNLNIPRYVDTFEEEEPVDLEEVKKMLAQDDEDIKKLEAEIA